MLQKHKQSFIDKCSTCYNMCTSPATAHTVNGSVPHKQLCCQPNYWLQFQYLRLPKPATGPLAFVRLAVHLFAAAAVAGATAKQALPQPGSTTQPPAATCMLLLGLLL